jgi:hypothetical protein
VAVVGGVIGSLADNVTTSLGADAIARPKYIRETTPLHQPRLATLARLVGWRCFAVPTGQLPPRAVWMELVCYPVTAWLVFS